MSNFRITISCIQSSIRLCECEWTQLACRLIILLQWRDWTLFYSWKHTRNVGCSILNRLKYWMYYWTVLQKHRLWAWLTFLKCNTNVFKSFFYNIALWKLPYNYCKRVVAENRAVIHTPCQTFTHALHSTHANLPSHHSTLWSFITEQVNVPLTGDVLLRLVFVY